MQRFPRMTATPPEGYRPNVGIVLFNRAGRVFAGRRIGLPHAWQMPQGGIDAGERPEDAAHRELLEEVGTDKAELVAMTEGWLRYDLPPDIARRMGVRGQTQKWALMRFTGDDPDIDIARDSKPEFDAWGWFAPTELLARIVAFKRPVYEQVLSAFADRLAKGDTA